jgi:hypothetical protein
MAEPIFEGGWSYTQKEMNELFKYISYTNKREYKVLEFGSGNSTLKLYDYFKQKVDNVIFYSYESDPNFMFGHKDINLLFYDKDNIKDVALPNEKFDLILIDGPNGDKRSLWYSKIRDHVKNGTIILVDDFNHYKCFSDELDRNFNYELLSFSDEPFVPYGEHSWKIVKIINTRIRLLYIQSTAHHKNHHAIMNYKQHFEIKVINNVNQLSDIDVSTFDCVFSPCCPIDVSKYPKTKFIFGPQFSVFPDEKQLQLVNRPNAIYIQPSQWVVDLWYSYNLKNNIYICPFGVDIKWFDQSKPIEQRDKVFIYHKRRSPEELQAVVKLLQKYDIQYEIFDYNHRYDENNYLNYLHESKFGIWVDAHESQGFALQEALACNVPLLVWNVTSMNQEYGSSYDNIPATTIPYWDERCGEFLYDANELEDKFKLFLSKLDQYRPRDFIVENLSIEKCEDKFVELINKINI